jgi:YD repeat-containing protein
VDASLEMAGVLSETIRYSPAQVQQGQPHRVALQVNASSIPTGRHDYSVAITQRYSDGTKTIRTYHGQKDIRNRRDSEFGNRWGLAGFDRLIRQEHGVSLEQGNGNMAFFFDNGQGAWEGDAKAEAAFQTLTGDWTGGFTLRDKYGNESHFNSDGRLEYRQDPAGNQTVYAYLDADGDGQADELQTITDPAGRITMLHYTGGLLSKVTDFAGRDTIITHDSQGLLTSVTEPDPDLSGPLGAPVTRFAYDPVTLQMTSLTDPEDSVTRFSYDFAGTLRSRPWAWPITQQAKGLHRPLP